uniref:Uncharacterized protein n=1 Tax=Branchiostoma floridae TaxID=7739 RepID=C3Z6U0_BRAFL|eukprot:XP_002595524.1 hypothetical protein BRAFLDRAFT_69070 [Branchiostoma floridae]
MPPCRPDSEIFQFAEGLSPEEREKVILAKVTGGGGASRRPSPPSPQHRLILPAADCRKNSSSTFNDEEDAGRHYREDLEDRVELDEDIFMTDVRTRRSSEQERLKGAASGPHDHAAVVIVPSDNHPLEPRTTIA